MYVPQAYRASAPGQMSAVVRNHPLALLVTNGAGAPIATHLPMIPCDDDMGDLIGTKLWGHLNRANPHWATLINGMGATVIFSGPGAYISPVNYLAEPAAPTWDFVSVHLHGVLHVIDSTELTLAVVCRTAALLEDRFGDGWNQSTSVRHFRSIVSGVGAFELEVVAADGMFKLSQEKDATIRQRLIDRFTAEDPGTAHAELGSLMASFGLGQVR